MLDFGGHSFVLVTCIRHSLLSSINNCKTRSFDSCIGEDTSFLGQLVAAAAAALPAGLVHLGRRRRGRGRSRRGKTFQRGFLAESSRFSLRSISNDPQWKKGCHCSSVGKKMVEVGKPTVNVTVYSATIEVAAIDVAIAIIGPRPQWFGRHNKEKKISFFLLA